MFSAALITVNNYISLIVKLAELMLNVSMAEYAAVVFAFVPRNLQGINVNMVIYSVNTYSIMFSFYQSKLCGHL